MEEETEAMAIQLSSLNAMDETLPKLPEHIIHFILRFLPCIKDLVRTSVISKTWLQAYRTFPILDFNLENFASRSGSLSGEEIQKQFIGFVNNRLQRFGNGKVFILSTVSEMAHLHAARWVSTALDGKIEHFSISIVTEKNCLELTADDSLLLPCLIPDRVLSAHWLKSLILVGPKICIPLSESSSVDLPLLTLLRIRYSDLTDDQLRKLLSGCPALEIIALLDCDLLTKVDISNHPNLESLEVTARVTRSNLAAIEVRAPKLKSFSYTFVCLDRRGFVKHDVVVKIHNSPELKSLTIRDWYKTNEWLHKFIAQFPLIENLTIDGCIGLEGKIRISNPLLEEINIMSCFGLKEVVISSKKLASFFLYTQPFTIPHTSIRMKVDNSQVDCMVQILSPAPVKCDLMVEASWYCKLNEFLTRHFMFKNVGVIVQALVAPDEDMNGKHVHKKLPAAACNIENLQLNVTAPSSCHSHILNGLLSACHPTTIELVVISNNPFVQLVCKELRNIRNKMKCCCKGVFKCWKHQLKEVKIEKIKGIKLDEDLHWDALFDLLPTLEDGNDIYFKLRW